MTDKSKSTFIFDLIEEFQVFDLYAHGRLFTDDEFNTFCQKYKSLSRQRDLDLFLYISSTPNLFRVHLPYSKWAITNIAFDVVWYYDEIIICDPLLQMLNSEIDLMEKKQELKRILNFFMSCSDSIKGGYLLLSGNDITPDKTGYFEEDAKLILEDKLVLNAYHNSTNYFVKPALIRGNETNKKNASGGRISGVIRILQF